MLAYNVRQRANADAMYITEAMEDGSETLSAESVPIEYFHEMGERDELLGSS
jgi:hypothetical protein